MKNKIYVIMITLVLIFCSFSAVNALELEEVNYIISGDSMKIDTLQLEPNFRFGGGQKGGLNLAFNGEDFHLAANMALNVIQQNDFKMDLQLMISDTADGRDFGKGVGLLAQTVQSKFNIYVRSHYLIDDDLDDHGYYRAGLRFDLGPRSDFDLSVGNQYWDLDKTVINLGLNFKM